MDIPDLNVMSESAIPWKCTADLSFGERRDKTLHRTFIHARAHNNNAWLLKRSFVIKGYASSMISRVQAKHFFGIITIRCEKHETKLV